MEQIKILMIDDNVSLIQMVKEYFAKSDQIDIVLEAHNGLEGMDLITSKTNEFDLILVDLVMPV